HQPDDRLPQMDPQHFEVLAECHRRVVEQIFVSHTAPGESGRTTMSVTSCETTDRSRHQPQQRPQLRGAGFESGSIRTWTGRGHQLPATDPEIPGDAAPASAVSTRLARWRERDG